MAYRDDDRDRIFDWRNADDRDRWERDYERRRAERGGAPEEDWYDWDRGVDRWHAEEGEPSRFGRWYGRFGSPAGVGSASGYSGMGGPGWTAGGYGDPGYGTSGFASGDYGTSRYGAGSGDSPSRQPMPVRREEHWRGGEPRWGGRDAYGAPDRPPEREPRWIGPYTGRGPKGYQRGDEQIREDVSERLMDDGRVDATDVEVRVENAEVTLEGTVPNRRMKRLAEDLAERVRGVRDVHNHLRIGEPRSDDRELSLTPEAERLNRE